MALAFQNRGPVEIGHKACPWTGSLHPDVQDGERYYAEPVCTGRSYGRFLCFLAFISHVSNYTDVVGRVALSASAL